MQITLDMALNDEEPLFGPTVAPWVSAGDTFSVIIRDYWRGEVRAGSEALERLRRRCQEQGWDYQATVEALGGQQ